jgi:hypothetical protein
MASETSLRNRNINYHPSAQRGPNAEDVPLTAISLRNYHAVMQALGTIVMFRTATYPMFESYFHSPIGSERNSIVFN